MKELLNCPYCGGKASYFAESDSQAHAIYCDDCPLGVEDNRMSFEDLAWIWNLLPRINHPEDGV